MPILEEGQRAVPEYARVGRCAGELGIGAGNAAAEDREERDEGDPYGWDEDEEHLDDRGIEVPAPMRLSLERRGMPYIGYCPRTLESQPLNRTHV